MQYFVCCYNCYCCWSVGWMPALLFSDENSKTVKGVSVSRCDLEINALNLLYKNQEHKNTSSDNIFTRVVAKKQ